MPARASIGVLLRASRKNIGNSAGEAGLLGACSDYSDTLLAQIEQADLPQELAISVVSLAELAAGPHATADPALEIVPV